MSTPTAGMPPAASTPGTGVSRPAGSRLPSLGRHGEGWVAGQLVLIALLLVLGAVGAAWPEGLAGALILVGSVVAAAGLVLLVGGILALGSALTPMPAPLEQGSLRQGGAFRLCRHPMYGGALLLATGWALGRSPLVLVGVVLTLGFLELKSQREEAWLEERYPEYPAYRRSVRRRLIPWVH